MTTHNHNKRNYSRPRIQRAFFSWFAESRRHFAVPLRITRRTKQGIELDFTSAKSMIGATLMPWEINVGFDWQGICWDLLICFEAVPELTDNGYVCSLCDPEKRAIYQNRELLWRDHLFEPFLIWVNNKLVKAPWIEIYGSDGGSTSARLLDALPENISPDIKQSRCCRIVTNPLYIPT